MGPAELTSAYAAIKSAKDIFSSLLEAKVDSEIKAKIIEAQRVIGEAQDAMFLLREQNFTLQTQLREVTDRLATAEGWKSKYERYALVTTSGGATVYQSTFEPKHYACPVCIESHKVIILQDNKSSTGWYTCPSCKVTYNINPSRNHDR